MTGYIKDVLASESCMSDVTRKMFEAISDPKNAHLFTTEAAYKAFSRVDAKSIYERAYDAYWDAELGRTAMRFVDRAGDVHPGIDDAERICAEFYAAMCAVIDRMPHVQKMNQPIPPTQND